MALVSLFHWGQHPPWNKAATDLLFGRPPPRKHPEIRQFVDDFPLISLLTRSHQHFSEVAVKRYSFPRIVIHVHHHHHAVPIPPCRPPSDSPSRSYGAQRASTRLMHRRNTFAKPASGLSALVRSAVASSALFLGGEKDGKTMAKERVNL